MPSVGQIVYAKCGREKGRIFIIVALDGEYVYLADGHMRRLEKPKKKKLKHIQITNDVSVEAREKLEKKSYLLDADIRKEIMQYVKDKGEE